MKDFNTYCKEFAIQELTERIDDGIAYYACDLGFELTVDINNYCELFDNELQTHEDYINLLKEWWNDAANYWEYEKSNFGKNQWNPFDNTECFIVTMVINGVENLINQCATVEYEWDNKFVLDKRTVECIILELEQAEICF